MPLFHQQYMSEYTRLAVWHITEEDNFFLDKVPMQRHITHPLKRRQHLAGRYLLQHLFPDFPFQSIVIGDSRQPYLPNERYHFSISHSNDYAAAIVSTQDRVGIDVEKYTSKAEKICHKFLHTNEMIHAQQITELQHLSERERIGLYTLLWGTKEALYKWWGDGGTDACKQLRIDPFGYNREGFINGHLVQPQKTYSVLLGYKMLENVSLVWAM